MCLSLQPGQSSGFSATDKEQRDWMSDASYQQEQELFLSLDGFIVSGGKL